MAAVGAATAAFSVGVRTQYPGLSALAHIFNGYAPWHAKCVITAIASAAIFEKAKKNLGVAEWANRSIRYFNDKNFHSTGHTNPMMEVAHGVIKLAAFGLTAGYLVFEFAQMALLTASDEGAAQNAFIYGRSLFPQQQEPIRIPWEMIPTFLVSSEKREEIDTYLKNNVQYREPPPPLNPIRSDASSPDFNLSDLFGGEDDKI